MAASALHFSRRHRRWLILAAAFGFSGYAAYRLYHVPSVVIVRSETNEIPNSLKQMAKLAASEEFTGSVSSFSEAVTVGIVRGLDSTSERVGKIAMSEEVTGSVSRFSEAVAVGIVRRLDSNSERVAKIVASEEFKGSVSSFSEAVTVGIARGLDSTSE